LNPRNIKEQNEKKRQYHLFSDTSWNSNTQFTFLWRYHQWTQQKWSSNECSSLGCVYQSSSHCIRCYFTLSDRNQSNQNRTSKKEKCHWQQNVNRFEECWTQNRTNRTSNVYLNWNEPPNQ
jgi:hypothetical protein